MSELRGVVDLIAGRRIAVVTGAGCSTASGIPDYGGLHSTIRGSRIQYKAFMNDPAARQRYWARSLVGWQRVARAGPNRTHHALVELERSGIVRGIITQNVDGLHHKAGSQNVVELHGTLSRVRCVECHHIEPRAALQDELLRLNPFLLERDTFNPADGDVIAAPDGDAELDDVGGVQIPACPRCGGILKPDVVFFGESVPSEYVSRAWALYDAADVLLTVGTSLAVFSGYRFVLRATKENKPVVIINNAETRGDDVATLVVRAEAGEVLRTLTQALAPSMPAGGNAG